MGIKTNGKTGYIKGHDKGTEDLITEYGEK